MSYIQQFFTSRDNNANAETFVGQEGRLWWDPVTNQIYSSDGSTPGGIPLAGGGGGNGTPGGSNSQVQFNQAGNFGGSANLTFNSANGALTAVSFVGNGAGLTSITGANVTGTVADAGHATVADSANAVTGGNVTGNVANAVHAYFADAANSVAGSNVSGAVANATYATTAGSTTTATTAGTVTTNAQPNITSVGALTSITSTGNISTTGNVSGNYFIGNGSLLTSINASNVSGNVANATYATTAGSTTQLVNGSYSLVLNSNGTMAVPGNLINTSSSPVGFWSTDTVTSYWRSPTGGGAGLPFQSTVAMANTGVTLTFLSGSGGFFTAKSWRFGFDGNLSFPDATVQTTAFTGTATSATTADTVTTNAQPNITSTGTLTSITSTGNISTTGNVTGNYFIGNGSQLTGIATSTYGNANVAANLAAFGSNPISTTGNITAGYFIGNGYTLTSVNASNVSGTVASATTATTAGTVTTNAQPNITSVGTLTSLSSGAITTTGTLAVNASGGITTNQTTANLINTTATTVNFAGAATTLSIGAGTGTTTVKNDLTVVGAFSRTGAISAAAWGLSGVGFKLPAAQYTDTSSSGTQSTVTAIHAINGPTIAASSAVTYTNLATLYIGNQPALGTNASATNRYSLYVSQGSYFNSDVTVVGNLTGATASLSGNVTGGNVLSNGQISAAGNITGGNLALGGSITTPGNIGASYVNGSYYTGTWSTNFVALGNISTTGNVIGGNVLTTGVMSSTGNINGNNIVAVGTVSATGATNGTAFAVGNSAVSNVALGMFPTAGTAGQYAIRDYSTVQADMYFDLGIGGTANGQFQFRSTSSYTQFAQIDRYGITLPTRPGFRVTGAGTTNNLTTTQNSTGALNGNNWAADYNQGSYLNSTTGVFTAPAAGLYQINVVGRNSGYAGGISQLAVVKNATGGTGSGGTVQCMIEWAASSSMNHVGSGTISKLAVNDTLALKVLAGQINFDGNDNWSVAFLG